MATNKDLSAEAEALAEKLGKDVTTDGLTNKQLADLVSDLKAKAKDAELNTQADDPAEAEAEAGKQAPGVYVAHGKSVTSKAGILVAGDEVTASHLAGGEEALAQLVKGKHCVEHK